MNYYKCKCGEKDTWSVCAVPACDGCERCGTTLEMDEGYKPIGQHEWTQLSDEYTGKPFMRCVRCQKRKEYGEQIQIQG